MPTVDIIIPAYNAAHFLPMALESVIAQTFSDWRILLVDDGSKDQTPEVARMYKERLGEKLTYIRQENRGLPAARNAAIRQGNAPFLALLDADDIWLPRRLEASLQAFENRPEVGLVYGFNDRIDAEGNVIDVWDRRNKHGEGSVAPYIYMRKLDLPCPTVTFRRSCVEAVGLFDESMRATEDRDLWLRIALRYKVALAPEVIAHYRVSPAAMSQDTGRMLRAQVRFVEKHYGSPGCGWMPRRVALSWAYRQRAEGLADTRRTGEAVRSALQSLLYWPFSVRNLRTTLSLLVRWARDNRKPQAMQATERF